MSADIQRAKELLEKNGYVVARVARPGWREEAVRLDDDYVAFVLQPQWKRFPNRLEYVKQPVFAPIRPNRFCELLGIDRHTLTRKLKRKDCPRITQRRGTKGRLIQLEPTQALIDFLLSHL